AWPPPPPLPREAPPRSRHPPRRWRRPAGPRGAGAVHPGGPETASGRRIDAPSPPRAGWPRPHRMGSSVLLEVEDPLEVFFDLLFVAVLGEGELLDEEGTRG